MKVSDIMNKAIAVDFDIGVKQAAKIMSQKNIGSLIILKKDQLVGIITERDIIKNVSNLNKKVSSVMSRNVKTIDYDDSIDDAVAIMSAKKIKRLPVLQKGKLVGIITATDIIANSDMIDEEFFFD